MSNIAENMQKKGQESFDELKRKGQKWVDDIVQDCKDLPTREWATCFGISFALMLGFVIATRNQDDPVLTFGLFIFTATVCLAAVVIRKEPMAIQYPIVVTMLSIVRLLADVKALQLLFFAAVPVIVNYIRKEVRR